MIELDGRSYIVNTPTENAFAMLSFINQFMIDNDVRNKAGEVVQFKISLVSPIWLLLFGIGYMATVCQKIMYAVAQAFNIADCSDNQVLNLAKIARLSRKEGSYTTVVCTATATNGGPCNITTDLIAEVEYENETYQFSPIYDVTIPAGTSAEVILICSVTGPVYFEAGTITGFTTEVEDLDTFVSSAPQPGSGLESISSLRTRLMTNEAVSPMMGAIQAINALDGISKAVVLYNPNYDSSMMLGGKTVPPKRAIIFVQGYSEKIAQEYYKYMSMQTYDDGTARQQSFTMENGQDFTVNYYTPVAIDLYIRVSVNKALTLEREAEIKQAIVNLSNTRQIGTNYTTAFIIDQLNVNLNFPEIRGIDISTDGTTWVDTTSFNEGNIGLIASSRISFKLPTE
jgi:hypothetical protein